MTSSDDNLLASAGPGVDRRSVVKAGAAATLLAGSGLSASASAATGREIVDWTGDVLARRIRARDVSCVEVMDAYLAQIRRFNPRVNAIVAMADEGDLRRQAAERDRQLARGEYMGWLHGMPQAIKDASAVKGFPFTSGSPLLKDFMPPFDAFIAERAKKAGAIVIGKTNVPEFALGSNTFNPVYGTTVNPYNLQKTVGGSSGGAAAALAAHMLPVADGSDFAGSIRNPPAFCNVFGLRPTAGVVPFGPSDDVFVQQFAIEGPMGRTVKDVAMLLSIQAGYDPRAPLSVNLDPKQFTGSLASDVKGKRIAWMGDWNGYFAMDPGVMDVCRASLKAFESMGCIVEEAVPAFDPAVLWDVWLTQRSFIIGNYLKHFYDNPAQRALLKDSAQWEVERTIGQTGQKVFESTVARSAWHGAVLDFFEKYDFAVSPTAQVFPFDAAIPWPKVVGGRTMETYHQWMGIVLPWSLAGTPVLAAPAGFSADGLPMGIQIVGKRQSELDVLKMGHAYEQATQWVQKRPAPLLQTA